jgi:DNA-binding Xre family transcriptional regulator
MLTFTMDAQKTYIEQLLDGLDWTIDKLAREADMSYSQTHEIVTKGFRTGTRLGNIEKLASVLKVSVVDLIDKHPRQEK